MPSQNFFLVLFVEVEEEVINVEVETDEITVDCTCRYLV